MHIQSAYWFISMKLIEILYNTVVETLIDRGDNTDKLLRLLVVHKYLTSGNWVLVFYYYLNIF